MRLSRTIAVILIIANLTAMPCAFASSDKANLDKANRHYNYYTANTAAAGLSLDDRQTYERVNRFLCSFSLGSNTYEDSSQDYIIEKIVDYVFGYAAVYNTGAIERSASDDERGYFELYGEPYDIRVSKQYAQSFAKEYLGLNYIIGELEYWPAEISYDGLEYTCDMLQDADYFYSNGDTYFGEANYPLLLAHDLTKLNNNEYRVDYYGYYGEGINDPKGVADISHAEARERYGAPDFGGSAVIREDANAPHGFYLISMNSGNATVAEPEDSNVALLSQKTATAIVAEASTPLTDRSTATLNNIDLAIDKADGTYVPYGEEYSFNYIVGSRGTTQGYQQVENGSGSTDVDGGVSQVATTIYAAVKKLSKDVLITKKQVYGSDFVQSYVSSGDDAIATAYSNDMDFRFINYYEDFIIGVWRDDERVYCRLTTGGSTTPNAPNAIPVSVYRETMYAANSDGMTGYALSGNTAEQQPTEQAQSAEKTLYVYNCESYISLREYDSTDAPRITTI
ncbi:MAG: VanW family protein, partial [Clostridia bacterium]|nr:VanW family protein [Clostridia bacterium]